MKLKQKSKVMQMNRFLILLTDEYCRSLYQSNRDQANLIPLTD